MSVDQFVNLPDDPTKNHGRLVFIAVDIAEAMPGAAEGAPVWFFVEPQSGNLDLTKLSSGDRQTGAHLDPPNRTYGLVDENKHAWVGLRVSIAGGDKFKFKASQNKDGSGALPATDPDEVVVWRRIYARVGAMPGCGGSVHNQIQSILESHFIEMDLLAGGAPLAVRPFGGRVADFLPDVKSKLPAIDKEKVPLALTILYVDRLFTPEWREVKKTLIGRAMPPSGDVRLPAGGLIWPDDADWLRGRIRVFDVEGELTYDWNAAQVRKLTRKSRSGWRHPEGMVTTELIVQFEKDGLRMAEWTREHTFRVEIELEVKTFDQSLGRANLAARTCAVAKRGHKYRDYPTSQLVSVALHEVGHLLGLVRRKNPIYDAVTGAETSNDDYGNWYEKNGGVGNHCGEGVTKQRGVWFDGSCVMCGVSDEVYPTTFCGNCSEMLRRGNLEQLG